MQLICLSATVANPDELAGWIGQVLLLLLACHTVFVLVIYISKHLSQKYLKFFIDLIYSLIWMFVSSLELDNKCDTTVCHLVHPGVSFFLLYLWWSVVLNLDNSFS